MLNNIKSKHLLEIYRKKAESKKQEERSDQSIFDDTSSTETDYTETIPSNASDVEDFASQYGSYAFYSVRFEDGLYDVCIVDYSEKKVYYIYGCLQPDKEQYDRKQQASCYYKNQLCI